MSIDLAYPAIYLVTRGEASATNFEAARRQILDIITIAAQERVPLVQIREKQLPAKKLFELAVEASAITSGSMTKLFVNDRADIAAAAGADGVHLTSHSLPVEAVRSAYPQLLVGVSTHSIEEIERAKSDGADFAVFGPVFATIDKPEGAGIATLRDVCSKASPFPVCAIGGIDETSFKDVLDAGAAGFAAIRILNDPERMRSIARMVLR